MQKFNSNRNSSGNRSNSSSRGRNDSRGGRNNFSSNRGSFNRGPREEHDAVCDKCGANCTLPFKPTEGKPVLCKDCFQKAGGNSRGRNDSRPRSNFSNRNSSFNRSPREEHKAVCDKCKKNCTVPFKPTPGKPVLCKECFQQSR